MYRFETVIEQILPSNIVILLIVGSLLPALDFPGPFSLSFIGAFTFTAGAIEGFSSLLLSGKPI